MFDSSDVPATRPYLIRALYEWCTDNGFTPFIAARVDEAVRVPMEFVKDGEIVLNISFDATSALKLGNDYIEFKGRFGGVARDILVPVDRVLAVYARENGQGMAFPVTPSASNNPPTSNDSDESALALSVAPQTQVGDDEVVSPGKPTIPTGRPTLTRIK